MTKLEKEIEKNYLNIDEVMLSNEFSCDYEKRRKCDSLYIEKNKKLKKTINEAIKLIEDKPLHLSSELKEELLSILERED